MQSLQQQFLTWCRSKPADEEYDYVNAHACAFYQFAIAHGIPDPVRDPFGYDDGRLPQLSELITAAAVDRPWTFGALADRLEAALS